MRPSAGRAALASAALASAALASAALACASHPDALARGQRYYEDNQYERALALWRDLERQRARFSSSERARYAYFRGMTDYRLGFRHEARHWLAIARAIEAENPGRLGSIWLARLDSALAELRRAPSRSGFEGADAVQIIEAPPGVLPPEGAAAEAGPRPGP